MFKFPLRCVPYLILVVAFPVLGATPSNADWIVARDGERLETKGPWEVKGKLVVFTLPRGQLSSLRRSRVDLAASQLATRRARQPQVPTGHPPRESSPVLVLTDDDVRRDGAPPVAAMAWPTAEDEGLPTGQSEEAVEEQNESPPAEHTPARRAERLTVSNWDEVQDDDGVAIVGRLQNMSQGITSSIELVITLLDHEGSVYDQGDAVLSASTLKPGQETNFRADFPQAVSFANVLFELDSLNLEPVPGLGAPRAR